MQLLQVIEAECDGAIVDTLAARAGLDRSATRQALRVLLPELGRSIRAACGRQHGAAAVREAAGDERHRRYLEDPAALAEPAAAADGERVLSAVLDPDERRELAARATAASPARQAQVEKLMPLVASLAMAAIGRQIEAPAPGIPWFGSREGDHFDAPLLDAVTGLFESENRSGR